MADKKLAGTGQGPDEDVGYAPDFKKPKAAETEGGTLGKGMSVAKQDGFFTKEHRGGTC